MVEFSKFGSLCLGTLLQEFLTMSSQTYPGFFNWFVLQCSHSFPHFRSEAKATGPDQTSAEGQERSPSDGEACSGQDSFKEHDCCTRDDWKCCGHPQRQGLQPG